MPEPDDYLHRTDHTTNSNHPEPQPNEFTNEFGEIVWEDYFQALEDWKLEEEGLI